MAWMVYIGRPLIIGDMFDLTFIQYEWEKQSSLLLHEEMNNVEE